MATIHKEFLINAPPAFVWDAIKDVGAVHTRLAPGFVTDTVVTDGIRTVTFANGLVVREQIVTIDDELARLAYTSVGGQATHHNAYLQVFPGPAGQSRVVWVTDVLPEEMRSPIAQMVELGASVIQQTLARSYLKAN